MKIKDNGLSIFDEKSLITWHPPLIGRMTLSGCEIDRVYWYSLLSERKKKTSGVHIHLMCIWVQDTCTALHAVIQRIYLTQSVIRGQDLIRDPIKVVVMYLQAVFPTTTKQQKQKKKK